MLAAEDISRIESRQERIEEKLDRLMAVFGLSDGQKKRLSRPEMNDIALKYVPWVDQHQAGSTAKNKKRMLFAHILPYFGRMIPDYIEAATIDQYKKKRLEETKRGKIPPGNKPGDPVPEILDHLG